MSSPTGPVECSDGASGVGPGEMKLINYKTFLDSYWPHFSQNLKKGLGTLFSICVDELFECLFGGPDPALVYSELMGIASIFFRLN